MRRHLRSRLITFVIAVPLLSACGSMTSPPPGGSPGTSLPAAAQLPTLADVPFYRADRAAHAIDPGPGPTGKPELAWRVHVGAMHIVPILVGGALIVGTNDGRLVALDAYTGLQRWDTAVGSGAIQPSLAAVDGLVFASDGSAVIAVDLATGTKQWSTPAPGATGRVNVVDGVVYVGAKGGVIGLEEETGKEVWRWDGPPDVQANSGPIVEGVGYFATNDGRLYAVDTKTGTSVWPSAVQSIGTNIASGQVVGDTFFVSNNQGDASEPVGEIYAIDRSSGTVRWRFRPPTGLQLKEGPVKDGVLYANGLQDGIYALRDDGTSATVVWHVNTPESHWPMALAGDTLYQARTDGSVGAYAISDGRLLWETMAEGSWAGGPIVSGGMVFVANDTTGVLAFADPALIAKLPKAAVQASVPPSESPTASSNPFTVARTFSWAGTGLHTPLGMDPGPDGLLYVFDVTPQVTVVDPTDGHAVRRWGRQGTGPGEFDIQRPDDNPGNGDIAVSRDGRVYVADGTNHRVQIFTPDGKFLFQFGSFGTGQGQFGDIQEIATGPKGEVYARDQYGISKFTGDGKFVWRSKENLFHFGVRADGELISVCEQCRQLLHVSQQDGHIVERWDTPDMDGDGFGPVNLDPTGNIYVEVYGSESMLIFDRHGKFVAGGYLQPGARRVGGGKKTEWGDWYWPTPVFMPDGRAFTFAEQGLVELTFTLPR
jgi:outer membrane protein assembly factor BamB